MKYRFFNNRKLPHKKKNNRFHPAIDLGISKEGKWLNIPITSHPTKSGKFTEFDENPNPKLRQKENGKNVHPSFFQRYIRKDKPKDKLSEYTNYSLVDSDKKKIDSFLINHESNKRIDKERREKAIKRKKDAKLRYFKKWSFS